MKYVLILLLFSLVSFDTVELSALVYLALDSWTLLSALGGMTSPFILRMRNESVDGTEKLGA
jgi:hypothetical protein